MKIKWRVLIWCGAAVGGFLGMGMPGLLAGPGEIKQDAGQVISRPAAPVIPKLLNLGETETLIRQIPRDHFDKREPTPELVRSFLIACIPLWPANSWNFNCLIRVLEKEDRKQAWEALKATVDEFLKEHPNDFRALASGAYLLSRLDPARQDEMAPLFKQAVQLASAPEDQASVIQFQAESLALNNRSDEAIALYEQAYALAPEFKTGLDLIECLGAENQKAKLDAFMPGLLQRFPEEAGSVHGHAGTAYKQIGALQDTEREYRAALETWPADSIHMMWQVYQQMALLDAMQGHKAGARQKAIEALTWVIETEPNSKAVRHRFDAAFSRLAEHIDLSSVTFKSVQKGIDPEKIRDQIHMLVQRTRQIKQMEAEALFDHRKLAAWQMVAQPTPLPDWDELRRAKSAASLKPAPPENALDKIGLPGLEIDRLTLEQQKKVVTWLDQTQDPYAEFLRLGGERELIQFLDRIFVDLKAVAAKPYFARAFLKLASADENWPPDELVFYWFVESFNEASAEHPAEKLLDQVSTIIREHAVKHAGDYRALTVCAYLDSRLAGSRALSPLFEAAIQVAPTEADRGWIYVYQTACLEEGYYNHQNITAAPRIPARAVVEAFEQTLNALPYTASAYIRFLGEIGDQQRIEALLPKALAWRPKEAWSTHRTAGEAYQKMGAYPEAEAQFRQALATLRPGWEGGQVYIRMSLAEVYEKQGKAEQMRAMAREALAWEIFNARANHNREADVKSKFETTKGELGPRLKQVDLSAMTFEAIDKGMNPEQMTQTREAMKRRQD